MPEIVYQTVTSSADLNNWPWKTHRRIVNVSWRPTTGIDSLKRTPELFASGADIFRLGPVNWFQLLNWSDNHTFGRVEQQNYFSFWKSEERGTESMTWRIWENTSNRSRTQQFGDMKNQPGRRWPGFIVRRLKEVVGHINKRRKPH